MSRASAVEQYMLELINAERAKVGAQPLAFNDYINDAGANHSKWMIATERFSHTGAGGSNAGDRMTAAGYKFTGSWAWGENISWRSLASPSGYQDEVNLMHKALMNSAGHRANILNSNFREIGIGFEVGDFKGYQSAVATQDFAKSGTGSFLAGVAFDDKDGDRFYDVGEGLGGISIKIVGSSGTYTTTTTEVGGYQLKIAAGTYKVTFSDENIATTTRQVTVGTKNAKLDLIDPASKSGVVLGAYRDSDGNGEPGEPATALIVGDLLDNRLDGTAEADTIRGRGGNDTLNGRAGNDIVEGGNDSDRLLGGAGWDDLIGGRGADEFLYAGGHGIDTIADFKDDVDTIQFDDASLGLSSKADALLHAEVIAGDVVFTFDDASKLIVENFTTIAALRDDLALE